MKKILGQLPFQLIVSILLAFLLGNILTVSMVSFFYTLSSCFISTLIFVLPVMVFTFIFRALANSPRRSLLVVLLIFAGVTISNCLALFTAYLYAHGTLPSLEMTGAKDIIDTLDSPVHLLFTPPFPSLIGTEKAMAFGLIVGAIVSCLPTKSKVKTLSQKSAHYLNQAITFFLQKIFLPLVPLYVFGFCLKLSYDRALTSLFQQFGQVFLLSMLLVAIYLCLLYLLAAGGSVKKALRHLTAMLPAGLTGFSTMSSAATMPVTLACTEKTTKDRSFTDLIIPSTANIHMLGDDLTIVMTAMALLTTFDLPWPDLLQFTPFVLAFALAKLSCVGVPGASVLVVLPVLQNFLGFNAEMTAVLTTIYILQDPFGTAANVLGNGAFALIIQRSSKPFRQKAPQENLSLQDIYL